MKINNIIVGMVGIMICAIMIGGAFLPAVACAVEDQQVKVNNDFTYYRSMADGDTIIVSDATASTFTVNGQSTSVPTGMASQVITSDSLVFSMTRDKATHDVFVLINGTPHKYVATMVNLTVSKDKIIGTVTTADNTVSINVPITWAFTFSIGESEWVQYNAYGTRSIKINNLDQLYGANWINTTNGFFAFNGKNLKVNGVVNDTIVFNPEKQSGYSDYYILTYTDTGDNTSFVVDNGGEDYTVHPFYMITPKSIMVTSTENAPIKAMFEVLPIVAIAGLVMAGIYVFISRK